IATAVAGSMLGINAFDQPNVQESKDYTKNFLDEYKKAGRLPEEEPILTADGIKVYGDAANRQALKGAATLADALKAHLARAQAGRTRSACSKRPRRSATSSASASATVARSVCTSARTWWQGCEDCSRRLKRQSRDRLVFFLEKLPVPLVPPEGEAAEETGDI